MIVINPPLNRRALALADTGEEGRPRRAAGGDDGKRDPPPGDYVVGDLLRALPPRTSPAGRHVLLAANRILLSKDLRVTQGSIFLRYMSELIDVGVGGQGAMPAILDAYLQRIEWSEDDLPLSIFPFTRAGHLDSTRLLKINPRIAFGRPIVERKAIKTSVIAERFKAGDSISDLAEDYDLEVFEVEEAIRYESIPLAA